MTHTVGESLAPFVIESVSADGMRQWTGFLDDPNPIHLDAEAVKTRKLGDRVINQGPANIAYVVNMLQRAFPGGMIRSIATRFLDNVFAGDRVVVTGRIVSVGGDSITCEFSLDVDGRGTVNAGTATIRI